MELPLSIQQCDKHPEYFVNVENSFIQQPIHSGKALKAKQNKKSIFINLEEGGNQLPTIWKQGKICCKDKWVAETPNWEVTGDIKLYKHTANVHLFYNIFLFPAIYPHIYSHPLITA